MKDDGIDDIGKLVVAMVLALLVAFVIGALVFL